MIDTFRFAKTLSTALLQPELEVFDPVSLSLVALPSDCDLNFHLNNGRYLALMDLGRMSLVARNGMLGTFVRRRWNAVVGAAQIEFLKEIPILSRYTLTTRIVGWDPKWFFFEQRFTVAGELAAVGRVQALFRSSSRGRNVKVPTAEVLAELGPWQTSPKLPREFASLAAPSPFRVQKKLSVDDLPGLDWAA